MGLLDITFHGNAVPPDRIEAKSNKGFAWIQAYGHEGTLESALFLSEGQARQIVVRLSEFLKGVKNAKETSPSEE